MSTLRIGLLGLGTVGQAVVQLNQPFAGHEFIFTRALVQHPARARHVEVPLTVDAAEILNDPAIDIVVEASGGREPARHWIRQSLENGKAVVTANKEVMAYHGRELLEVSESAHAFLGFEASVAGGIPVLDALRYHLSAAPIDTVYGVINGTTNYLLTAMANGQPFEQALAEAQKAGYAEADPSADIRGWDAVRKLVILISLAFGVWTDPDAILTEGLQSWPASLFERLASAGWTLRLLALARRASDGTVQAQVHPTAVPLDHPLGRLTGPQNGVGFAGQAGSYWLEGPGAGGAPTATSIWADIRRSVTRRTEAVSFPLGQVVQGAQPVRLPRLAVAQDPDRRIDAARPLNPTGSIGLMTSLSTIEGVWQFPAFGHEP